MKPLRILQVTRFLSIGGLETVVMRLSKQLAKEGVQVEILCLCGIDQDYVKELEGKRIPIHVIKKSGKWDFYFFKRVADFIRGKNFDIVHAHGGCFLYAAIFSKLAGINNFYFTAHGMPIFTGLRYCVEDSLACLFTKSIVSVSSEIEQFLKKWLKCPLTQFVTISNGIDTSQFKQVLIGEKKKYLCQKYKIPSTCMVIGTVGRLESVKNYGMLLHVVKELISNGRANICCVIVGEGSHYEFLVDLAQSLEISRNILFLGMQYDIAEIVVLFDVFILTSLTEGTSISLLEAQSCGVPAVVTNVGGNGTVVKHGVTGYVSPVHEVRTMAKYIESLLCDDIKLKKMGGYARQRVEERFSLKRMADNYLKLYQAGQE